MPSASVAAAALRSSAAAKPSTLRSVGVAVQPPVRSPGEASLSSAMIGGSAGVSSKDGDTMHPVPSVVDQAARGLGPVAVTVSGFLAKPSSATHLDFPKLGTDLKSCTYSPTQSLVATCKVTIVYPVGSVNSSGPTRVLFRQRSAPAAALLRSPSVTRTPSLAAHTPTIGSPPSAATTHLWSTSFPSGDLYTTRPPATRPSAADTSSPRGNPSSTTSAVPYVTLEPS
ncbi:uncharacterized protein LOC131068973 [Cryptomeria japonica]|uniref:uncharacterized protein LOC131068973 n=1 Tax=Cryptomeria japonica TaxID=3369 RepID=UPI0027DA62A8|nr:uncharacterized protein LOC131068973 [Cryptomeria japonica]